MEDIDTMHKCSKGSMLDSRRMRGGKRIASGLAIKWLLAEGDHVNV